MYGSATESRDWVLCVNGNAWMEASGGSPKNETNERMVYLTTRIMLRFGYFPLASPMIETMTMALSNNSPALEKCLWNPAAQHVM